jgi:rubredoxin
MSQEAAKASIGTTVYTEEGEPLGTIRGLGDNGFFVTTRDGAAAMSVEHERSGHEFGEAELAWRCGDCGEMGKLDSDLPDTCPSCDAPKENLFYYTED